MPVTTLYKYARRRQAGPHGQPAPRDPYDSSACTCGRNVPVCINCRYCLTSKSSTNRASSGWLGRLLPPTSRLVQVERST